MEVLRTKHDRDYTVISNKVLRDMKLSMKARGLMCQMLSLPESWKLSVAGLVKINQEGKDAIRAALSELEKAGYIRRRQSIDKRGRFGGVEYLIIECPDLTNLPPEESSLEDPPAVTTSKDAETWRSSANKKGTDDPQDKVVAFPSGEAHTTVPHSERHHSPRRVPMRGAVFKPSAWGGS